MTSRLLINAVYFNYDIGYPRKILSIKNGTVLSADVTMLHDFYVCPCATRHKVKIKEFKKWNKVMLYSQIKRK